MNIDFKKTSLDDDALIYQKAKDSVSREDLKNLSPAQKLQYFRDYYAKKVLIAVCILIAVGSLLNSMFFNRSSCLLSVYFLNDCQPADSEALNASLEQFIGVENKNDYVGVETFFLEDAQQNMVFTARVAAGSGDLILCSRETFLEYAKKGLFADLSTFLPAKQYAALSDRILEGQTEETDQEGNVISSSDPIPMGIDLSESSAVKQDILCDTPVLCVLANAQNLENTQKAISYFVGEAPSDTQK